MIRSVTDRLPYLRLLVRRGFWRWVIDSVDYLVLDRLEPWTRVRREYPSMIHPSVSFRSPENVEIGRNTRIQPNCVLWASPGAKIRIGEHSGLGPGTMIFSSNHQFQEAVPYHKQPWTEKDVTVGRDVWIGAGSVIVAGVTIGDCCVIAAGSVVTRDIPPNSLAAGVPAKVLRTRTAADLPGPVHVDA